ncbi:hypothetical protein C8Q74DRAFT_1242124 [Fomes fomentarius]|nr:hypothetical protein C8Q74DRAFT_1242124 [Fomes fomentarius]
MSPTVFVTGPTGTMGGAAAHEFLRRGWAVRATVRDDTTPVAVALKAAGAVLVRGDWNNEAALKQALHGCTALFLNLLPDFSDFASERRHGQAILDLARAAGVKHVVYSSVLAGPDKIAELARLGFGETPGTTVIGNKVVLEDATRAYAATNDSGEKSERIYTLLRPGWFMANLLEPKVRFYGDMPQTGVWTTALRPDTVLPLVDERDVAAFAAAAIEDPERFGGKEIAVVSQVAPVTEVVAELGRAAGRELALKFLSDEELPGALQKNPLLLGQAMSRDLAKGVDMESVKAWGIPTHSWSDYLEWKRDLVLQTYVSKGKGTA